MMKKLLFAVVTTMVAMGFAFAQVDVNKANEAALDGVKGIGPAKSKMILEERSKGGDFKDWADLEKRVKGIGAKNSMRLSKAGLQVNGQSKAGAPMDTSDMVKSSKPMPTVKAVKPAPDSKAGEMK